jgi:Bacterial Ig-like domain
MIIRTVIRGTGTAALLAFVVGAVPGNGVTADSLRRQADDAGGRVHALFDFSNPGTGPFPSDYFTVADNENNTGRRLNLPYPDCTVYDSDCQDLEVVNTLDGFGLQTRISIPFDGPIDLATINSHTVFLIRLPATAGGSSSASGINQIVWDPATLTLHVETDELLRQHERYAVIVTRGVRDAVGESVKATKEFRHLRTDVTAWYRNQLLEALGAAASIGINEQDIVVASVYTTQTVTSVMERIRDQIKSGTPAPANFAIGPAGERAVFDFAKVTRIDWNRHIGVNPDGFDSTMPIDLRPLKNVVSGAIGKIAYGYYVSPDYIVHPGEYIPAVGTRSGIPPVQRYANIYFTLYLPSGSSPAAGWPIALIAGGTSGNQHMTSGNFAAKLAANGIASIGINHVGQGFGPLGALTVNLNDGFSLTIPDAGRGLDQDDNHLIGNTEGSEAADARAWTIAGRDGHRQTVIDFMQLVEVIKAGMDVDGDAAADIDPSRIYFLGASAGSMIGTIVMALDPDVPIGVAAVTPGVIPEHARWQPVRRGAIGLALSHRTPSLINSPGLTEIDGVAVGAPYFNENKPLRNLPPVANTVEGAMDIQTVLEYAEMVADTGLTPAVWARHLREEPLRGLYPKSVLYLLATGDQQAVNPGTSVLLRAGNLLDRAIYYRHDLAYPQDPLRMPKNPHTFAGTVLSPSPLYQSIGRGAQDLIGAFLASDGTVISDIDPGLAYLFEVPIASPLPEALNFIR